MSTLAKPPLATWTPLARSELLAASARLSGDEDIPGTRAEGQLIRPLVAIAGLDGAEPTEAFWDGVLAIQLAHEASLLHDDVIDAARTRRGVPTVSAERGVGRALLAGDHLLTSAYRAAARTESIDFVTRFARSVERTVAGEAAQGRSAGSTLDLVKYREIVLGKSGELLGCALSASATLQGAGSAGSLFEIGRRIGLLYQMLDDLLDYCPLTETGKEPLEDYDSGRWTWVLAEFPQLAFGLSRETLLDTMYGAPEHAANVESCRRRITAVAEEILVDLAFALPREDVMTPLISGWLARGHAALDREVEGRRASRQALTPDGDGISSHLSATHSNRGLGLLEVIRARVPKSQDTGAFLATHSRSFRFASRFFDAADARRVAGVYAYCRVTDDLVDRPERGVEPEAVLDAWMALSAAAYGGAATGLPVLDDAMREMAASGVPFEYAADLAEGMRMDLRNERYATLEDLHRYTYRVASVVGLWITRLAGCHQPGILDRASRMGRAMQMTNILRDVGEDLRRDRVYLPTEYLDRYEIDEAALRAASAGGPLPDGYARLVEELIVDAEKDYSVALAAVPMLPRSYARPVAVAAHVYRGIHREIRRRNYDNLRHRVYTGIATKCSLAATALWQLRSAAHDPGVESSTPGAPAWVGLRR